MNHQEYHILLSKFSHEVRNPAALITSFLQLLAREYPEITACSYYRQIQENLQLLRQLLDEISHYSNASRISPKPVNFREFLQEMARDPASAADLRSTSAGFHRPLTDAPGFLQSAAQCQGSHAGGR